MYRQNLAIVYVVVAIMNAGAWLWALVAFADQPVLLGVGVVVYGLGLRHALDADHIAAIDNVTRKLLQEGRHFASIGFWFALGHSAVIFLATAALVAAAGSLKQLQEFREVGGIISTAVSGLFLLLVAMMNICVLLAIIRTMRRMRAGHAVEAHELDALFSGKGLISRFARPLFRCVSRPWHMALLGFLFGLSFDTASEVALFAISATQAAHGVSFCSTLVYPMLFAAGMSLLDTTDGVVMVGAYHWAVADPLRKLSYNLTITLMSIAIAVFIGGVQLCMLAVRWLKLRGPFATGATTLSENSNYFGIAIVAVFMLAWLASVVTFQIMGRGSRLAQANA
jgi:nickel/cobalt transporter (NiCoT) family protein